MTANDEYIVEILESVGLITREQADTALSSAREQDKDVVDVLTGDEVVARTDVLKALANQFGMETVQDVVLDDHLLDTVNQMPFDRLLEFLVTFKTNGISRLYTCLLSTHQAFTII